MNRTREFLGLLFWCGLTFVAAALGAWASTSAPTFYAELARPAWAPPAWLFGPAWTTLYILMALAAWLVWRRQGWSAARGALALFAAQLAANALWSWLFFAWRQGLWASLEIVLVWLLVAATAARFRRHHRWAAWLLLPYLAWVTYAAALCVTVWRLNPGLLG